MTATTVNVTISPKLLSRVARMFSGKVRDRIIEILQNARRAGATEVKITNSKVSGSNLVTIRDNGSGIESADHLLTLGDSGWDAKIQKAEDPAGVGFFCLSDRDVTVRSRNWRADISPTNWIGKAPVHVVTESEEIKGTEIWFYDEPWSEMTVSEFSTFSGLTVTVDGAPIQSDQLIKPGMETFDYPEHGYKLAVVAGTDPTYQMACACFRNRAGYGYSGPNVLLNFYGYLHHIDMRSDLRGHSDLRVLVQMTGEKTDVRLVLPARQSLHENEASKLLRLHCENAIYATLLKKGSHTLPWSEYNIARGRGFNLPEASPTLYNADWPCQYGDGDFGSSLLDMKEVEKLAATEQDAKSLLVVTDDSPTARTCENWTAHGCNAAIATTLHYEAGGPRFYLVRIPTGYGGYSWAQRLRRLVNVKVKHSNEILASDDLGFSTVSVVKKITMTMELSDKQVIKDIDVPCAAWLDDDRHSAGEPELLITPKGLGHVSSSACLAITGVTEESDDLESRENTAEETLDDLRGRCSDFKAWLKMKMVELWSKNTSEKMTSLSVKRIRKTKQHVMGLRVTYQQKGKRKPVMLEI